MKHELNFKASKVYIQEDLNRNLVQTIETGLNNTHNYKGIPNRLS